MGCMLDSFACHLPTSSSLIMDFTVYTWIFFFVVFGLHNCCMLLCDFAGSRIIPATVGRYRELVVWGWRVWGKAGLHGPTCSTEGLLFSIIVVAVNLWTCCFTYVKYLFSVFLAMFPEGASLPKRAISFPDRGWYEYDQIRVMFCLVV